MGLCWVSDCNHHSTRNTCKFFTFPNTPGERIKDLWLTSISRPGTPTKFSRICSCHFVDGNKANGPTIFKRLNDPNYSHLWKTPKTKTRRPTRQVLESQTVKEETDDLSGICDISIDIPPLFEDSADEGPILQSPSSSRWVCRTKPSNFDSGEYHSEVGTKSEHAACTQPLPQQFLSSEHGVGETSSLSAVFIKTEINDPLNQNTDNEEELALLCERENHQRTINKLQSELDAARKIISDLSTKNCVLGEVARQCKEDLSEAEGRLMYKQISCQENRIVHYTGLPNAATFTWLLSSFTTPLKYYSEWNVCRVTKEDQLFLTLMKLRQNPSHTLLADWFNVSKATVTNIFRTWLSALHTLLFQTIMKDVPSREKNKKSLPEWFVSYQNCRMIIDCTEMRIVVPDSLREKNLDLSSYKSTSTVKGLIGMAPSGTVTYCSELYPGSISDKCVVQNSGIMDIFEPGDLILADEGLLIQDLLPAGVVLNTLPCKSTTQLSPAQVKNTTTIARARIHVERAIKRVKEHKILDLIPASMFACSTEVFQTCCALSNLNKNPLIAKVEII